jgi:hypothetical protein
LRNCIWTSLHRTSIIELNLGERVGIRNDSISLDSMPHPRTVHTHRRGQNSVISKSVLCPFFDSVWSISASAVETIRSTIHICTAVCWCTCSRLADCIVCRPSMSYQVQHAAWLERNGPAFFKMWNKARVSQKPATTPNRLIVIQVVGGVGLTPAMLRCFG